jgi:hypothetical protein
MIYMHNRVRDELGYELTRSDPPKSLKADSTQPVMLEIAGTYELQFQDEYVMTCLSWFLLVPASVPPASNSKPITA